MKRAISIGLLLLLFHLLHAQDPNLPPGFVFEKNFISGLQQPTDLKFAPDGRIFVTEKIGRVRVVENGVLLPQPFYTVATQTPYERGLDGIVLDPDFEHNGYVYIYYTLPFSNQNRLSRVTAAGNTALPGSEVELMTMDAMYASWHNGGGMAFDTAGKLIVGIGDGTAYSPWMTTNRSKILRLNTDGSIPTDNYFYTQNTGIYRAIVASGVRNPYTMAASRVSGRIFFNDVGMESWEEVNELSFGKNYGWPFVEGMKPSTQSFAANYSDPVYVFDHNYGCAVLGATFYEPNTNRFPAKYFGKYFFLEYCESKLLCMDPDDFSVTEFGADLGYAYNNIECSPDGDLYLANVSDGTLSRIRYLGINSPPHFSIQPRPIVAAVGENVAVQVSVAGDTVSYDWYRNGNLVQSGPSDSLLLSNIQLPDNQAALWVRAINPHGYADSDTVLLTVINGTRPTIQFLNTTSQYAAGDTIHFAAQVTDAEQQTVPPSDWTWRIAFHHDSHAHPAMDELSGVTSGTYPVETNGEVDTNVYLRVHLTAMDSSGLSSEAYLDILPKKVTMLVQSFPPGVEISVDGNPATTDYELRSVQNLNRTIRVPSWAVIGDSLYDFVQWQDGADTLIRGFMANTDTLTLTYQAIARYFPSQPATGNMHIYKDTASSRVYYKTKIVSRIQENWDLLNPYIWDQPVFPSDYWAARWEAAVVAPVSDLYTFYLFHDSEASLWIADSLLVDRSLAVSTKEDTVQIWLNGGDTVSIVVDYNHHEYLARVELDWSYSVAPRHNLSFTTLESPLQDEPHFEIGLGEDGIALYPNPTDGNMVTLYLERATYLGKNLEVEIYDNQGHRLLGYHGIVSDVAIPFSIQEFPSGLYLVRVITPKQEKVIRFIRQ